MRFAVKITRVGSGRVELVKLVPSDFVRLKTCALINGCRVFGELGRTKLFHVGAEVFASPKNEDYRMWGRENLCTRGNQQRVEHLMPFQPHYSRRGRALRTWRNRNFTPFVRVHDPAELHTFVRGNILPRSPPSDHRRRALVLRI